MVRFGSWFELDWAGRPNHSMTAHHVVLAGQKLTTYVYAVAPGNKNKYRGGETTSPPSVVGEDAPGMVVCTRVGAGLSSITCVFRLNYSDAEEARQRVASAYNTCRTTRQMGLDFGCPQAWMVEEVPATLDLHRHLLVILHQYISIVSLPLSKGRHQTTPISPPLVSAAHGGSPPSLYEASFPPNREKPQHGKVKCHPMALIC
ncbi:hypothetical protein TIFTF001_016672 [Ficus carica]|uniref:Uncharacterized protein n=1 Tax=Ficus carica TaxID=3494 RepID=A0AA88ATJ2_FICCA|nr:hypothetical protein TIFTF001_016672 [Ficus carica]